jgi:hypothetical protein
MVGTVQYAMPCHAGESMKRVKHLPMDDKR